MTVPERLFAWLSTVGLTPQAEKTGAARDPWFQNSSPPMFISLLEFAAGVSVADEVPIKILFDPVVNVVSPT